MDPHNDRLPEQSTAPVNRLAGPERAAEAVRVLVIDDNRDAADSLKMALDLCGYETRVAYTGTEGLWAATAWCPDVVLSDLGLPGLTGFEIARALRACPDTAHTLLVAITGYGSPEDRDRALASGFHHHFTKAVEFQILFAALPRPSR